MRTFYGEMMATRMRFAQLNITDAELSTLFFIASIEKKLPKEIQQTWNKKLVSFQNRQRDQSRFQILPLEAFFLVLSYGHQDQGHSQFSKHKKLRKWK